MNDRADVIVIGAGIIGCAVAHELAHEKLSVVVVEQSTRGAEASSAAGGILSPQAEAAGEDPFFDLCIRSRELHGPLSAHLLEESGIDVEYADSGVLYVALEEATVPALEARANWQHGKGYRVEPFPGASVAALEPHLTVTTKYALHFAADARVNNVALTRALGTAADAQGVRFLEGTEVTGLLFSRERVTGVITRQGTISSGWVVDAAGAWASAVDGRLRERLPIRPVRGQMVALGSAAHLIERVIYSEDCYLVPRRDGRVLIGSTLEEVGYDKTTTIRAIHQLIGAAMQLVPELARCPFDSCWAGLRPASLDHLPVLGPDPELRGLIYAAGHFRNGILLAPITAEIIRDLIITGTPSVDLSPFRAERFFPVTR